MSEQQQSFEDIGQRAFFPRRSALHEIHHAIGRAKRIPRTRIRIVHTGPERITWYECPQCGTPARLDSRDNHVGSECASITTLARPLFAACQHRHNSGGVIMAWRPSQYLIEGELDNTEPGKVTGWMQFAGMKEKVTLDLKGNFHRDIRGAKVHLAGDGQVDDPEAAEYMEGLALQQTGEVGDMTAGLPPRDYVRYPYYARSAVMRGSACLSHRSCGGAHRDRT